MKIFRLPLMLFLCCAIPLAVAQVPNDPGEPRVITGKVIDSAGQPVPDAKVYAKELNQHKMGAIRYVTTDQNGQFRIGNLRPGDYDVYAVPAHSASMLSRWTERVHLPKEKPKGEVTIQVGSSAKRHG